MSILEKEDNHVDFHFLKRNGEVYEVKLPIMVYGRGVEKNKKNVVVYFNVL